MSTDTSQHQQISTFNNLSVTAPPIEVCSVNNVSPISMHTSQREPWPKVIMLGVQQLSVNANIKPVDQSPKVQNYKSGSTGLQKSSSLNKRGRKPFETTPVTPKAVPSESFETVRAKMRESLAAAFELVVEEQDRSQNASQGNESLVDSERTEKSHDAALSGLEVNPADHNSVSSKETMRETCDPIHSYVHDNLTDSLTNVDATNVNCDNLQEFQQTECLTDDSSLSESILMKDDLLQENGLCWASFVSNNGVDDQEHEHSKRPKFSSDIFEDSKDQKPQILASEIEEELFKLFGGVNKKYKEKGRSLLFNLKDRHNPELRLRVFSGDISPKRLCSMSAEELASKELSQWRIAKAEELAQMVVLPDLDVNLRMVKKTHKGEFQVEVQQDDSVSVEVTVGTTLLSQFPIKGSGNPNKQLKVSQKASDVDKSSQVTTSRNNGDLEEQLPLCDLDSIQHENTDFMQDLMVEEAKDALSLPPVPSLDEFMMELASEPPLETTQGSPVSGEKSLADDLETEPHFTLESQSYYALNNVMESKLNPGSKTSENGSKSMTSATRLHQSAASNPIASLDALKKGCQLDTKFPVSVDSLKQSMLIKDACYGDSVWEGLIQLNISSLVTALGFHRSGEQVPMKEWPSFLEIKGRVRLDAFEKFLQELRLSRSRAITVLHFCWKEGSPESGRMKLCETVDSYIVDERVGFAEPVPGLELYFCPSHPKTTSILLSNLSKEHEEALVKAEDGLLGILISKKEVSPRLVSHPRKHTKKHSLPQVAGDDLSTNLAASHHAAHPPQIQEEEIDDVPPGFGPGQAVNREDDDLPEFSFAQDNLKRALPKFAPPVATVPLPPTRPVEQIREMIQKYGSENFSPWNDDEDDNDDIPEWKPDLQINTSPNPVPYQYQQQLRPPQVVSQFPPVPAGPMYPNQFAPGQWDNAALNNYGRGGRAFEPRYLGPPNSYAQNRRGWNPAFPRSR